MRGGGCEVKIVMTGYGWGWVEEDKVSSHVTWEENRRGGIFS